MELDKLRWNVCVCVCVCVFKSEFDLQKFDENLQCVPRMDLRLIRKLYRGVKLQKQTNYKTLPWSKILRK